MTDDPDNPERPQIYESDQEVIEQAIRLLAELDDAPLNEMTPLYYQHGFEELRMVVDDLLRILRRNPSEPAQLQLRADVNAVRPRSVRASGCPEPVPR